MGRIYGYLRASTREQDAHRARQSLVSFAAGAGQDISGWFVENESGSTLRRPELFRLLDLAQRGDVLLVEQVDRISRLNSEDWETLKSQITDKGLVIVALDLPTSLQFLQNHRDEFTQRMLDAVNAMMLDMLAAVARKDYEDRRRRQSEGIARARKLGRYKGRKADTRRHETIAALLEVGKSYGEIVTLLGCSRSTIAKVRKSLQASPDPSGPEGAGPDDPKAQVFIR